MAIPNHYRALMGLHSAPDEISNVPFNAYPMMRRDPNLGALGWGFKKAFKSVAKAVAKPVAAVVKPVATATFKAPVNIAKTAVRVAPGVVKNFAQPMVKATVGVVKNPTSIKSWTNFVAAPVKSQINLVTGTTNATVALAKDAVQPVRTLTAATGVDTLATQVAQATKLDKVGNAVATGAAITSVIANDLVAKQAGLAPLVPSPLPRTPEAEQLAEDVAYVEQQEQVAEAMADAADRAATAGDVEATTVLTERAREAANNAQEGQKDVVDSAKAAVEAGNDETKVAAAIAMVKARAGAEAKNVIAKVATDAKNGTLPPGMSPAATQTVEVKKAGAAGKAIGAGAGALIGTMFMPGIGTVIGAAAGLLFGQKADAAGAAPGQPVAGLSGRRRGQPPRRRRRAGAMYGLNGVQWDPSSQSWRYK